MIFTDIDIDVANREEVLSGLDIAHATMIKDGELIRHPSGVYFNEIPRNPYNNLANIPYDQAEELGYFKIDILNNSLYTGIKDELHLVQLINTPPRWDLLLYDEFVQNLHHVNKHARLLKRLKPKSIEELAMILAIIRPAKAYLQNSDWDKIKEMVWLKEGEEVYQFKKSHAISYAMSIVVQMNHIMEQL